MWAIRNRTPYAVERTWVRDKAGAHHWLVVVQATFDISPMGVLELADEQPPPLREPRFRGDPAHTSLRLDSDLLALKPGTDVILDACAHAPRGKPAKVVPVTLRVSDIEKKLMGVNQSSGDAGDGPSEEDCKKAIKLLEQPIRLAEKMKSKLSEARKAALRAKINAGTITSNDLPGSLQREFPGKLKGKTLNEVKAECGKR